MSVRLVFATLTASFAVVVAAAALEHGSRGTSQASFPLPTLPPPGVLLIVDTPADTMDAGDGKCSLREAIAAANINGVSGNCSAAGSQSGGTDGIEFALGSGVPVINVTSPLPTVMDRLAIDGASGGATRVELRGPGAGTPGDGLYINAPSAFVQNLVINNFAGAGIDVAGSNVTLRGNFIGTNADGTSAVPNHYGVFVTGTGHVIGGTNGTGFAGS